jgi:hypothetical protein
MPSTDPPLWTKQEDETQRAYNAFCVYRNLGWRNRSLQKVHDQVYGKGAGNLRYVEQWSSQYDWVDRAAAYDEYMAERMREELEQRRIEDKIERIASLDALHEVIDDALESLNPSDISPGVLEKLLKLTIQQKRAEYDDEPTQRVEGELDQVHVFLPDNSREDE